MDHMWAHSIKQIFNVKIAILFLYWKFAFEKLFNIKTKNLFNEKYDACSYSMKKQNAYAHTPFIICEFFYLFCLFFLTSIHS